MAWPWRVHVDSPVRTISGAAAISSHSCTFERRSVLVDAGVVDSALGPFRRTAALERFAILAYCFMPDHVHLLVEARADTCDLRHFAKMSKQRSGGVYGRSARQRLWQEGYYDRVLRREDDAYAIAIHLMNRVRAGLAKAPTDYPHQGSDVWAVAWLFQRRGTPQRRPDLALQDPARLGGNARSSKSGGLQSKTRPTLCLRCAFRHSPSP